MVTNRGRKVEEKTKEKKWAGPSERQQYLPVPQIKESNREGSTSGPPQAKARASCSCSSNLMHRCEGTV